VGSTSPVQMIRVSKAKIHTLVPDKAAYYHRNRKEHQSLSPIKTQSKSNALSRIQLKLGLNKSQISVPKSPTRVNLTGKPVVVEAIGNANPIGELKIVFRSNLAGGAEHLSLDKDISNQRLMGKGLKPKPQDVTHIYKDKPKRTTVLVNQASNGSKEQTLFRTSPLSIQNTESTGTILREFPTKNQATLAPL